MLRRTVRNYLALTALAVAGGLMAMQAKSGVLFPNDAEKVQRAAAVTPQEGTDGVIEVDHDLAIREGPRELARADRDANAGPGLG